MQHTTAQPPIEAFAPAKVYTAESVVDVATLNECIEQIDLPSATTVYNALVAKKTEIPEDVKQSLLELVTFYNATKPLPVDAFEERDHAASASRQKDFDPTQWKSGGFAERLFNSMEPKTTAAYNTMTRGLLKFNQSQRANVIYEEMVAKDVPIDTNTYNALIAGQYQLYPIFEQRWESVEKLLRHMNECQVAPNVQTMNAILDIVRSGGSYAVQRQKALSVLAEFKSLNIEPRVGTWAMILKIFCRERVPISHILVDILDHLGDSELQYQHQSDANFFMTAMSVCNTHVQDFALAQRLDRLLNIGQNYQLIGDSFTQRIYYRAYLQLAVKALPLPEFTKIYDDIVPNVYSIEVNLCDIIIGKINESGSIEFIPKFWSDMLIGGLISHRFSKTIELFLDVMCDNPPQSDVPAHANLNERFGESAWNYWQRLSNEVALERVSNIAAPTLGKILLLCCRHKQFERATEILDAILVGSRKSLVTGVVSHAPLNAFVKLCIKEAEPSLALNCLSYAVENGFEESEQLGKLIADEFTLNERDARRLNNLVGKKVRMVQERL